jgi:hypothetical protein
MVAAAGLRHHGNVPDEISTGGIAMSISRVMQNMLASYAAASSGADVIELAFDQG